MNLDDYTKELFEELGWQDNTDADSPNFMPGFNAKIDMHNSEGCEEDCAIDDFSLLSERFATQIAKEVQRREIAARFNEQVQLCEVTSMSINSKSSQLSMAAFALNVNDFQKRRTTELEQQLKELEQKQ